MGKAILAGLPDERVREIVDRHGLPRTTERTLTDEEELFAALEAIRDRGRAYDEEERMRGLCCVAAAIRDPTGAVLGAISVSGPRNRLAGRPLETDPPKSIPGAQNVIELNVAYE